MQGYDMFEIWMKVQEKVRRQVSDKIYEVWFKPITPLALSQTTYTVSVRNQFFKQMLEQKYAGQIEALLQECSGRPLGLQIECEEEPLTKQAEEPSPPKEQAPAQEAEPGEEPSNLNPRYVFENFVIGNSNRLAWSAAQQVAERPGYSYNPLFIYGGVGLGKTHLMHAIGNKIKANSPATKVLYISSEQFTNEIINSIYNKTTEAFRSKYRRIDCLIIDDIQFLKGKEQTQVEFFHTFNTLYEANKQIVISSDRLPKEIETLEDRLRTRFEKGLLADIQVPDLETRMAILRQKAAEDGLELPGDVVTLIAANVTTNIRQIEGAYTRLKAFTSLMNMPMNVATAQQVLTAIGVREKRRQITFSDIVNVVAEYYNLDPDELFNKKRNQNISYPRQIAMYMCREYADMSYPKIGEAFGGRDHTTVIHAYEKISKSKEKRPQLQKDLEKMKERLQN